VIQLFTASLVVVTADPSPAHGSPYALSIQSARMTTSTTVIVRPPLFPGG
jgi:hypothetical protein